MAEKQVYAVLKTTLFEDSETSSVPDNCVTVCKERPFGSPEL